VHVTVPQPTLSDVLPDPERLIQTLRHYGHPPNPRIDHDVLPILPRLLREYQWDVTEVLPTLSQVCALERGDTTSEMYGYVVDIGTSKLVGVLVDLVAGEALNTLFVENPQLPLTSQFKEGLDSEGPRAEIMGLPKLTPGLLEITSVGLG